MFRLLVDINLLFPCISCAVNTNIQSRSCTDSDLYERVKTLEDLVKKNKNLIARQTSYIEELKEENKVKYEVENRKRALIIAKQKFESKKNKFHNEEIKLYEEQIDQLHRKYEEEEFKRSKKEGSPFQCLMRDLASLCKDPVTGVLMNEPTSLPSGNIYEKKIANSIMAGRYKKFNEPNMINKFREDNFTKKLTQIVKKYQKNIHKPINLKQ